MIKTFPRNTGFWIAILSGLVMVSLTLAGHAYAAPAAGLSTDTLNLSVSEDGTVTFSGNDGGRELRFVWTFPEDLTVNRGDRSNLDTFRVNRRKRKLKVETEGDGSFFAEILLSSDSAGTYVLSNKAASISINPEDVTVNVGGSPPVPPSPPPVAATFTIRVCEGASWEIRRNMVLRDLYLFSDGPCSSSPTLPGPEIRVSEGDDVTITFINDGSLPHALIFPGLNVPGAGVPVAPGTAKTYVLPTNMPGTFYYAAAKLDVFPPETNPTEIDRGMYGGIVVRSEDERLVRPEFDAVRFFDEIPRDDWNETRTTVPGEPGHEPPTYLTHEFLVNGKTIDSKVEGNNIESVVLHGAVGEDMVMRMICIGSETHALHLHGHIPDVTGDGLTTNSTGTAATIPTDVVRCPSGDVRNLYVAVRAPGTWVWHCHRETHLLNNLDADYPGGMFTHLDVSGGGEKDD